jgi:hypothetical protein
MCSFLFCYNFEKLLEHKILTISLVYTFSKHFFFYIIIFLCISFSRNYFHFKYCTIQFYKYNLYIFLNCMSYMSHFDTFLIMIYSYLQ